MDDRWGEVLFVAALTLMTGFGGLRQFAGLWLRRGKTEAVLGRVQTYAYDDESDYVRVPMRWTWQGQDYERKLDVPRKELESGGRAALLVDPRRPDRAVAAGLKRSWFGALFWTTLALSGATWIGFRSVVLWDRSPAESAAMTLGAAALGFAGVIAIGAGGLIVSMCVGMGIVGLAKRKVLRGIGLILAGFAVLVGGIAVAVWADRVW